MSDYCENCDCLIERCECNDVDNILVLDLETTSKVLEDAKILEISIFQLSLFSLEYTNLLTTTINHTDLTDKELNSWIFKNSTLSHEDLVKGMSVDDLRSKLQSILSGQAVTSYNTNFDLRLLALPPYNLRIDRNYIKMPCVMRSVSKYLKIPATTKQKRYYNMDHKSLRIDEAYRLTVGEPMNNIHRSSSDAENAVKILISLIKNKAYDLSKLSNGKFS